MFLGGGFELALMFRACFACPACPKPKSKYNFREMKLARRGGEDVIAKSNPVRKVGLRRGKLCEERTRSRRQPLRGRKPREKRKPERRANLRQEVLSAGSKPGRRRRIRWENDSEKMNAERK